LQFGLERFTSLTRNNSLNETSNSSLLSCVTPFHSRYSVGDELASLESIFSNCHIREMSFRLCYRLSPTIQLPTHGYDNLLRKNLFRSLVRVFSCFSFETFTNSLLPLPQKIKLNPDLSLTPGGNSVEFSKHFRLSDESDRFSINVFTYVNFWSVSTKNFYRKCRKPLRIIFYFEFITELLHQSCNRPVQFTFSRLVPFYVKHQMPNAKSR
jgi:hypothetical protein